MVNESSRVTSELLWRGTAIALLIDIPLLLLVGRFISSQLFRQLKWHLVSAAFLTYAVLWGVFGSVYFWDSVYRAVFPGWSRWLLPIWFGVLFLICMQLGLLLPPHGLLLMTMKGVSPPEVTMGDIFRAVVPYVALSILLLIVLLWLPGIATWLPSRLG